MISIAATRTLRKVDLGNGNTMSVFTFNFGYYGIGVADDLGSSEALREDRARTSNAVSAPKMAMVDGRLVLANLVSTVKEALRKGRPAGSDLASTFRIAFADNY
ncbi:MAG: hypothetical protein KGH64_02810 [Candidatus Micrarchaeota archaeon]|nr:hypothetical protein [Candidatus Micrarchaeota archaeon]MDE1834243.1 hypothetical protein [Candidatus Micrarchaeota archaeon]MDE1859546.1 hypothetical protein [Candidatus Micrarchaeota archaeon]